MKMVTQEPEWIIGIGLIVIIGLVFAFWKTGAKPLVPTIGAVLALIVGLLVLERMVVTDEEELLATLDDITRAVERGAEGAPERGPSIGGELQHHGTGRAPKKGHPDDQSGHQRRDRADHVAAHERQPGEKGIIRKQNADEEHVHR